ncbi:MAG: hypothetical protein WCA00_00995 [Candidatus Acidiferrales bacterium]
MKRFLKCFRCASELAMIVKPNAALGLDCGAGMGAHFCFESRRRGARCREATGGVEPDYCEEEHCKDEDRSSANSRPAKSSQTLAPRAANHGVVHAYQNIKLGGEQMYGRRGFAAIGQALRSHASDKRKRSAARRD